MVVVGAAIVRGAPPRVLAACRASPPRLAGRWELPGGKVEPGEGERAALARECREELGVVVRVAERVGPDLPIGDGALVLRVFRAELVAGEPVAREHAELRWLAAEELASVRWLPADEPLLAPLAALLSRPSSCAPGRRAAGP